jgi:hypothetical protein
MSSKNCKEVYIPRIEAEQGKCPHGYTNSDCVIVTSCISGFQEGTLTDFVRFLDKLMVNQRRQTELMEKQIKILQEAVSTLKDEVKDLQKNITIKQQNTNYYGRM